MKSLEFDSVISSAWELTKKHWLGFSLLMLVYGAISQIAQSFIPGNSLSDVMEVFRHMDDPRWIQQYQATIQASSNSPLYYVGMLLSIIINIIYQVGVSNLSLRIARGQVTSVSLDSVLDAFRLPLNVYLMMLVCGIVIAILCGLGLMCCVLPFFYVVGAFYVYEFVLIDQPELSIVDVFKRTFVLTKGNVLIILGLVFTQIVIAIMGFVCCCVGIFPAIVMCSFISVSIYLSLKEE